MPNFTSRLSYFGRYPTTTVSPSPTSAPTSTFIQSSTSVIIETPKSTITTGDSLIPMEVIAMLV